MRTKYFNLCTQTEDKAEKCIHCTKYWLSQYNYQCSSLLVCNNWGLKNGCQYAEKNVTFEGQFNPEYLEQLKAEAECDCPEYDLINKKCRLPKCCWS